jgi:hypothetical protein
LIVFSSPPALGRPTLDEAFTVASPSHVDTRSGSPHPSLSPRLGLRYSQFQKPPKAARITSLSAPGDGEGRGEVGDIIALVGAHLTLPVAMRRVPSLSALRGGEG